MEFRNGQNVKVYMNGENLLGNIVQNIGNDMYEVKLPNTSCTITVSAKNITNNENKFKVGESVSFYEGGNWYGEGVVTGYSTNCVGKKLVVVKDLNSGSQLVFYEHEVMKVKGVCSK